MKLPALLVLFLFFAAAASFGALGACDSDDDDDDDDDDGDNDDDDDDDDDDDTAEPRQIDAADLEDKIRGSWVGQMAGVTWGATTEFQYMGTIIPENEVPVWEPDRINRGYLQDDIYVELPFMDAMVAQGVTVGWEALGDSFGDSHFPLAHANLAARMNLRKGIAAPDSGHYINNAHCDDIDWQIEADFAGALCPGLINPAIEIAWRVGHVMNFGDGVLGGVFVSAMHAAAFFAQSVDQIIEAGRQALPEGSIYRQVVQDILDWHAQGFSWEETWQLVQDRWGSADRCPTSPYWSNPWHNIDAKLNGAYVLMGLLWGEGDFENSMRIAMRCGQDSDCNPSSVGGILGNWMGLSQLPEKFKSALESDRRFIFTNVTLDDAIATNLDLARQVVDLAGGKVEGSGASEVWTIPPATPVQPPILEQWPQTPNAPPALTARVRAMQGRTVTLEAKATDGDGVLEIEWYFGDLSRGRGPGVEHTYDAPGQYRIVVFAADGIGNTSWQALTVSLP